MNAACGEEKRIFETLIAVCAQEPLVNTKIKIHKKKNSRLISCKVGPKASTLKKWHIKNSFHISSFNFLSILLRKCLARVFRLTQEEICIGMCSKEWAVARPLEVLLLHQTLQQAKRNVHRVRVALFFL